MTNGVCNSVFHLFRKISFLGEPSHKQHLWLRSLDPLDHFRLFGRLPVPVSVPRNFQGGMALFQHLKHLFHNFLACPSK